MVAALENNELDAIGMGRPLCVEPDIARRLLVGDSEAAPAWEASIRLGNGLLGPNSRINFLKAMNAQSAVAWFYRQIIAISEGQPTNPELRPFAALRAHLRDELQLAWRRRRYARA